jgi:hypothetical protein
MAIDANALARICARAKRRGDEQAVAGPEDVTSLARELSDELLDLFWATGLLDDGSSERAIWLQLSRETTPHADLANGLTKMARASNPLSQEVCSGEIAKRFQRKLAIHWARKARAQGGRNSLKVDHPNWHQLTRQEQFEIRRMAGDLAHYHRGLVPPRRPRKNALDTLLWELADMFARYSGRNDSILTLPSAERSLFIQFCHLALRPRSEGDVALDKSEVSVQALSERWRRLKTHAESEPPTFRSMRRSLATRRSRVKTP